MNALKVSSSNHCLSGNTATGLPLVWRGIFVMEEIWKDIPEYEGRYQVSNLGNVKNVRNGHILSPFDRQPNTPSSGYMTVHLGSRHLGKRFINKSVHSLVLLAFTGKRPLDKPIIHHKDFNKANNSLSNLEYCIQSHNRKQDFLSGNMSYRGEKNNSAVINSKIALEIVSLRTSGVKNGTIAEKYGLTISGVSSVFNGHTWSHITGIKRKTT